MKRGKAIDDLPFRDSDTLKVSRGDVSDLIAELSHSYHYLLEDIKEEKVPGPLISAILEIPRDRLKGKEGLLDSLMTNYYEAYDTTGLNVGGMPYEERPYYDPNLTRNKKPNEYISHTIIEPWMLEKYNIDSKYFSFPSGLDWHKGHR